MTVARMGSVLDATQIFTLAFTMSELPVEQCGVAVIDEHGVAIAPLLCYSDDFGIHDLHEVFKSIINLVHSNSYLVLGSYRIADRDRAAGDRDRWRELTALAVTRGTVLIDWLIFEGNAVTSHNQTDMDLGIGDRWAYLAPQGADQ